MCNPCVLKKAKMLPLMWLEKHQNLQRKPQNWLAMVMVFVREDLPFSCHSRACSAGPGAKTECSVCPQPHSCTLSIFNKCKALSSLRSYPELGMCVLCRTGLISWLLFNSSAIVRETWKFYISLSVISYISSPFLYNWWYF